MANIYLKVHSIDELNYRQEWMKDSKTMSYNAGFDYYKEIISNYREIKETLNTKK